MQQTYQRLMIANEPGYIRNSMYIMAC